MASMEVVSLTDFISLRTRTYGTFKAKGVKITTGGCLCGRIKFEFTGEAFKTVLCHCIDCRRLTGSAYSTNIAVLSSAVSVCGQPKQYMLKSSQGFVSRISFCYECSSTLWRESDADGLDGYHIIQAGTLGEELGNYLPQGEFCTRSRSIWLSPLDKAKQFEGTKLGL